MRAGKDLLIKINEFLKLREKPLYSAEKPTDCMLNVILSKDTKGVSSIYGMLLGKNVSITEKACKNWNENIGDCTSIFRFKKSFSKISMFDDIYLRNIQFRTLHRRFLTDNILYKVKIKDSPLCKFCLEKEDSNEHILIECVKIKALWHQVEDWISNIGVIEYSITNGIVILG